MARTYMPIAFMIAFLVIFLRLLDNKLEYSRAGPLSFYFSIAHCVTSVLLLTGIMRERLTRVHVTHSNAHYSPHSHSGLTTHLILRGQLTITYPKDDHPEKKTYSVGDRIDVDAGKVHEVWMGSEGCTYVIGE